MPSFVDTGDAGLSLLDAVLEARAGPDRSVPKTSTRLLVALRRAPPPPAAAGAAGEAAAAEAAARADAALAELAAGRLREAEPDASGVLLLGAAGVAALLFAECSPEAAVAAVRRLAAAPAAVLADARVLVNVEDCPRRLFHGFHVQKLAPPDAPLAPAAAAAEVEAEPAHAVAGAALRAVTALAHGAAEQYAATAAEQSAAVRALGEGALGALAPYAFDERLAAVASAPLLPTPAQWCEIFADPIVFDTSAERALPLPARVLY